MLNMKYLMTILSFHLASGALSLLFHVITTFYSLSEILGPSTVPTRVSSITFSISRVGVWLVLGNNFQL